MTTNTTSRPLSGVHLDLTESTTTQWLSHQPVNHHGLASGTSPNPRRRPVVRGQNRSLPFYEQLVGSLNGNRLVFGSVLACLSAGFLKAVQQIYSAESCCERAIESSAFAVETWTWLTAAFLTVRVTRHLSTARLTPT